MKVRNLLSLHIHQGISPAGQPNSFIRAPPKRHSYLPNNKFPHVTIPVRYTRTMFKWSQKL